eukprot:m51a1_g11010 putative peptidyl-prolyl cis-trans isomerase-like 3 (161) ;mRNA; r:374027-374861
MSVTLKTSLGDIKVELHCDVVPLSCENFLALCGTGYYDNTVFHRNIKGFIVQGGDPTGTGKGGTSIWGKTFKDEFSPQLKHDARGVVSMANSGPDTNGSQFFITYGKHAHLNGVYTVIGRVIDGWQTLDAMERAPVDEKDRPTSDIVLKSTVIHANPLAQ